MTDAEIDKISLMRDDGKTVKEIAVAFGKTYYAMQRVISDLISDGEIGKVQRHKHWTDAELDELIRMKTSGFPIEDMISRFEVSPKALQHKIRALIKSGRLPDGEKSWKNNHFYEYLDARNLCHGCMKREKFGSKQFCPECLEKIAIWSLKPRLHETAERKRERYYNHKENGVCTRCHRPATHGVYCYHHYLENRRRQTEKARRHAWDGTQTVWDIRKANHLCRVCGKPIEEGNTTQWCNACRERQSKVAIAVNARMKAEGRDFKFGRQLYEQRTDRSTGQGG